MKIKFFFAWFDIWVGVFWDSKHGWLYICPLPCCCIVLMFLPYRSWKIRHMRWKGRKNGDGFYYIEVDGHRGIYRYDTEKMAYNGAWRLKNHLKHTPNEKT